MSCEVICCEVPALLHTLIDSKDGRLLKKLFTFLDQEGPLDCYLAGYFEKILEMLFRKLTSHMMSFFNSSGVALLKGFLSHVDNYSIMQIIQRLMLPHLPFSAPSEGDDQGFNFEDQRDFDHCNWSFLNETCELLLTKMLKADHPDIPLHISDMLITVLQLSPPETLLVKYLCQPDSVKSLLISATTSAEEFLETQSESEVPSSSTVASFVPEQYSLQNNIALAATSVLESLISRLYESGFPLHNPTESDISRTEQELFLIMNEQLNQMCEEIAPNVPRFTALLSNILQNTERRNLKFTTKLVKPRLGHHGLQLVKLIESLTRVGNPTLDRSFCENGLFEVCIDLLFAFEYNSIMHLSIQRIFVTIFEGPATRSDTQAYICSECDLLRVLMGKINRNNYDVSVSTQLPSKESFYFSPRHSSIMGNVILIAHAAFLMLDCSEDDQQESGKKDQPKEGDNSDHLPARALSRSLSSLGDRTELDQHDRAILVRNKVNNDLLLEEWDEFSQSKLREVLDHQTMGSYEMPPADLMTSQDDPLKLGVDLDVFGDDDVTDPNDFSHDNFAHFPITKHQEMHQDPESRTIFSWSQNAAGSDDDKHAADHSHEAEDDFGFADSGDFAEFADFASFENNTPQTNNDFSTTQVLPTDSIAFDVDFEKSKADDF